jgi:hypothetical protein
MTAGPVTSSRRRARRIGVDGAELPDVVVRPPNGLGSATQNDEDIQGPDWGDLAPGEIGCVMVVAVCFRGAELSCRHDIS